MLYEGNDPDINFLNDKSEAADSPYFSIDDVNSSSQKLLKNSFSILHISFRSLNKNFEKLREYMSCKKGFLWWPRAAIVKKKINNKQTNKSSMCFRKILYIKNY